MSSSDLTLAGLQHCACCCQVRVHSQSPPQVLAVGLYKSVSSALLRLRSGTVCRGRKASNGEQCIENAHMLHWR